MDHEIRQFESNLSYVEGRAVELFVDKWLLD